MKTLHRVFILMAFAVANVFFLNRQYSLHGQLAHRPPATDASGYNTSSPSPLKTILYWNDFFRRKDYDFGTGQQPFLSAGCRINTCYATFNRTQFPPQQLDAVLWHFSSKDKTLPQTRSPHTRFVFVMEESPHNLGAPLSPYNGIFNYTMTYRTDSDLPVLYGRFVPRTQPAPERVSGVNFAAGKTKVAAWFVSHCNTSSNRDMLVQQLQQRLPVDVYGACSGVTCPTTKRRQCMLMVQRLYKFYLAFENSLCVDYVTEKFFEMARYNVLPVVYGAAEYESFAPPRSYINALDYKSVRELADYLLYLDRNDTAYNEYFQWKADYDISSAVFNWLAENIDTVPWCSLCEKLHTDAAPKTYVDIERWFTSDMCLERGHPIVMNYILGK